MSIGRTARRTSRLSVEASSYVGRIASRPLPDDHSVTLVLSCWLTLHHLWLVPRETLVLVWEWPAEAQLESEHPREALSLPWQSCNASTALVLQSVKTRARRARAQDPTNTLAMHSTCGQFAVRQVPKRRRLAIRRTGNGRRGGRETRPIPSENPWRSGCSRSSCHSLPISSRIGGCFDEPALTYPCAKNGSSTLQLPERVEGQ